jgi:hypothetical protein
MAGLASGWPASLAELPVYTPEFDLDVGSMFGCLGNGHCCNSFFRNLQKVGRRDYDSFCIRNA